MEFFLVIAVAVVLCIILGVSSDTMIFLAAAFAGLLIISSFILFIWAFVNLVMSHRVTAQFSRIDKSPTSNFKVAYYITEGNELPNIFPEEGFLRSKFYPKNKPCKLRLSRSGKFVFDKFACATTVTGFISSTLLVTGAAIFLLNI